MSGIRLSLLVSLSLTLAGCGDVSQPQSDGAADVVDADVAEAGADVEADSGPGVDSALDVTSELQPDEPDIDLTLDTDQDGLPDHIEEGLGTDPRDPDSDRDGVSDGDEVNEDTDPLDPSSASAWLPDLLTDHPRLYFSADDLPSLRERAALREGPHAVLYARLRSIAQREPPTNEGPLFDSPASQSQGQIAEAAAFVGLLEGDEVLLQKAVELMAAPFPDPAEIEIDMQYDIREAQGLAGFCSAYDMLAGSDLVDEDQLDAARAGLEARLDAFREVLTTPPWEWALSIVQNNHAGKVDSALGLCAIALNDRPTAALDINEGITGLVFMLADVQAGPEGGHAEGWNYLTYGSNSYLPFMAAYHRVAGGETRPYRTMEPFSATDPRIGEVVDIVDPVEDPRIRAMYELALWSVFPNGLLPDTDDANQAALHGGLLAALYQDARYLWNWDAAAVSYMASWAEVATFALLDPAMEPGEPEWEADGSFPDDGFALLRSGLEADATYFLIQGEHGPMRIEGGGHEHPDATSFLLWHGGEYLLLDAGYVNWDNRLIVNKATDHNLILVDGEGPPADDDLGLNIGVDAFIDEWDPSPRLSSVRVSTHYVHTDVERRVVRVDGRYFVVADRVAPDDGEDHTYTFQLNGNGDSERDTYDQLDDGGLWRQPLARVEVHTSPAHGTPAYGERQEEHGLSYGRWTTHSSLEVKVTAAATGFLSVVYPTLGDEPRPSVQLAVQGGGVVAYCVSTDAGTGVVVQNLGPDDVELALSDCAIPGGEHSLSAPGGLTILHLDGDGSPEYHRQFEGRAVSYDGESL